jgi:hypothetical protein
VLLAYVDESYSQGWDRYWIAALLCPEQVLGPLSEALDDVVAKAASSYSGIGTRAELHGHALLHGKDDWLPLAPMVRARIGVYNDAFAAIGSSDVKIMIRGVHVPRLNERYVYPDHPHTVVLQHLLERINDYAVTTDQSALVIADEVDRAKEYRRELWRYQRQGTTGLESAALDQHRRHHPLRSVACQSACTSGGLDRLPTWAHDQRCRPGRTRQEGQREAVGTDRAAHPTQRLVEALDAQGPRARRGPWLTGFPLRPPRRGP